MFTNYWFGGCNLQFQAWANMMHWNPQILEFKEFEEARKERLAIPINYFQSLDSSAVIDIAKY